MKYILMIFVSVIAFKTLSFAVFNWKVKNKRAAVGTIALALLTLAGPILLMIFDKL